MMGALPFEKLCSSFVQTPSLLLPFPLLKVFVNDVVQVCTLHCIQTENAETRPCIECKDEKCRRRLPACWSRWPSCLKNIVDPFHPIAALPFQAAATPERSVQVQALFLLRDGKMAELQAAAGPPAQLSAEEERRQRLKAGESIAGLFAQADVVELRMGLVTAQSVTQTGHAIGRWHALLAAGGGGACKQSAGFLPLNCSSPQQPCACAAGEAYFAKVLHQSKGKDLLSAAKSAAPTLSSGSGGGSSAGATQRLPLTVLDEDFMQAGAVIEGARTYVLGTIFVAAQAVQLVFLKVWTMGWGCGCGVCEPLCDV